MRLQSKYLAVGLQLVLLQFVCNGSGSPTTTASQPLPSPVATDAKSGGGNGFRNRSVPGSGHAHVRGANTTRAASSGGKSRYDYPLKHSVAGCSSGGGMSANHLLAFSGVVVGAGIVAGNPYGCASLGATFDASCNYNFPPISVPKLLAYTEQRASQGLIDPVTNLAGRRVYVYQGTEDTIVFPDVGRKTAQYFAQYVDARNMLGVLDVPSEHGDITDGYGECCNCLEGTYILNCSYDQAGAILKHIYGAANLYPRGRGHLYNFHTISQKKYAPRGVEWDYVQMYDNGYTYVPTGCIGDRIKSCRLHVQYHGCGGGGYHAGPDHLGYADWGEANNIVIVYPQASWGEGNWEGCWDWWGITGDKFDTHEGLQLNVVLAMINDLGTGKATLGPLPPQASDPPRQHGTNTTRT